MTSTDLAEFSMPAVSNPEAPAWLTALRREGAERFQATGFPTSQDEEWRFTPIGALARTRFSPPSSASSCLDLDRSSLDEFFFGHAEWPTLVFINGQFAAPLSTRSSVSDGIAVLTLAEALEQHPDLGSEHFGRHAVADTTPFAALNQAMAESGAVVVIREGVEVTTPIHLVYVSAPEADATATHLRNLIVVEPGARGAIVESFVTLNPESSYFTNAVTEISMGRGAWLEHARIQRESERAYHIGYTHVSQERDSHYRSFTLAMGAALSRHNLHTNLGGPESEALLYGLSLVRGEQLADNHTAIHHAEPNCRSWEVYKAILADRSRGVFNGKVLVDPIAQKTDAKQTNRSLLLSPDARMDTKPQLEIFADDVKCTHGATVGQLDEITYFYCQSRGIPRALAQSILTRAFAAEVIDEVAIAPVREFLNELVARRLGEGS